MKVLVTGASGFVGQWLVKALQEKGHSVIALVRNPAKMPPLQQSQNNPVEYVAGDVLDLASLEAAFSGVHVVFHLAGLIGYKKSDRAAMSRVNVTGTGNVIAAIQSAKCQRLVHFSSVATVGASFDGQTVLNENSPYNLAHLNLGYFETKRQAEQLVITAAFDSGVDAVIVNPSNIYGPGDAQKGSRSTQLKVARGEFPFYTSGGVSVVHIEDVVSATIRAAEIGRRGERYILSGENISIKDLFVTIAKEAGVQPPSFYLPNFAVLTLGAISAALEKAGKKGFVSSESARASILYHWFDHAKATKELSFSPRPAAEAIRDSVNWMSEQRMLRTKAADG